MSSLTLQGKPLNGPITAFQWLNDNNSIVIRATEYVGTGTGTNVVLATMGADGKNKHVIATAQETTEAKGLECPSAQPGGNEIAYVEVVDTDLASHGVRYDIKTMSVDGTNKKTIASYVTSTSCPYWSPDGKQLAYSVNSAMQTGATQEVSGNSVYRAVVDANGARIVKLVGEGTVGALSVQGDSSSNIGANVWSADSKSFLFKKIVNGLHDIYMFNTVTNQATKVTANITSESRYEFYGWAKNGDIVYTIQQWNLNNGAATRLTPAELRSIKSNGTSRKTLYSEPGAANYGSMDIQSIAL